MKKDLPTQKCCEERGTSYGHFDSKRASFLVTSKDQLMPGSGRILYLDGSENCRFCRR